MGEHGSPQVGSSESCCIDDSKSQPAEVMGWATSTAALSNWPVGTLGRGIQGKGITVMVCWVPQPSMSPVWHPQAPLSKMAQPRANWIGSYEPS